MDSPKPGADQEAEWIEKCQHGEREAFGRLVERYQRRVFSIVFHLLRRADQVEDLAQEIFMKAFLAIRSYNFQASFGTWLSQIAVNHCYDYLRRARVSRVSYHWQLAENQVRDLEGRLASPRRGELSAEQHIALRDPVAKLLERAPAEDRTVLALKELEGLSVEEIAEILKLKPGTVKVRLHRARKRMLEDLNRWQKGR